MNVELDENDMEIDVSSEEDENDEESLERIASRSPLVVEPFSLVGILDVSDDDEDDLDILVSDKDDDSSLATTDLSYLCNVISQGAFQMGLPKPRQPWKEPLAKVLTLAEAGDVDLLDAQDKGRKFILGQIDLPALQTWKLLMY